MDFIKGLALTAAMRLTFPNYKFRFVRGYFYESMTAKGRLSLITVYSPAWLFDTDPNRPFLMFNAYSNAFVFSIGDRHTEKHNFLDALRALNAERSNSEWINAVLMCLLEAK